MNVNLCNLAISEHFLEILAILAPKNPKNLKIKILVTTFCKTHFYLGQFLPRFDHLGQSYQALSDFSVIAFEILLKYRKWRFWRHSK